MLQAILLFGCLINDPGQSKARGGNIIGHQCMALDPERPGEMMHSPTVTCQVCQSGHGNAIDGTNCSGCQLTWP